MQQKIYTQKDLLRAATLLDVDPGNPLIPHDYRAAIVMLQDIAHGLGADDVIVCTDNSTTIEHVVH